jgi:hypothetical protein
MIESETPSAQSGRQESQQAPDEGFTTLRSVLAARQTDIRLYRTMFFSTLASAFTVPLGALTVQHPEMFHQHWLYFIPYPGCWIFVSWAFGIISMLLGLHRLVPRKIIGMLTPEYWEEKANIFAAGGRSEFAVDCMTKAIKKEKGLLDRTLGSKNFFFAAFALFGLGLALELGLVLTFSPAPIQILIPYGR